jgi:uncharacterized protein YneF (UPF0154 family)
MQRYLVSIILLFMGLIQGGVGGFFIMRSMRTNSWPTTQGTVTISTVSSRMTTDDDGDSYPVYEAMVHYRYKVNGKSHIGKNVSFGEYAVNTDTRAKRVSASYPVGKSVKVYYNPENHGEAVLVPGALGLYPIFLVVGILLIGGAIGSFLWIRKKQRKPRGPLPD